MKLYQLSIVLSLVNFVGLVFVLFSEPRASNVGESVVRCRALEVVDDQDRVRACIKVLPAETFQPTGKPYPETVILRLIDANGRPEVKIVATEQGGALGFVGRSDETQVKLEADGDETSLTLIDKDGKQQQFKP